MWHAFYSLIVCALTAQCASVLFFMCSNLTWSLKKVVHLSNAGILAHTPSSVIVSFTAQPPTSRSLHCGTSKSVTRSVFISMHCMLFKPPLHSENTNGVLVVETVLVEMQYVVSSSKSHTVAFTDGSLLLHH